MSDWQSAIRRGDTATARDVLAAAVANGTASYADVPNSRLLQADAAVGRQMSVSPIAGDSHTLGEFAQRIAIVSLLFNWPSTGGGIIHTAELCTFLSRAGYEVCHFYAVYEPWGIGQVRDGLPYHLHALVFDQSTWHPEAVMAAFRETVAAFQPDAVIVTDSWNSKPLLAHAVSQFPYFLRLAAQECICPLNNVRLLPQADGPPAQCLRSQLSDPQECRTCVGANQATSGGLHQLERKFSGFSTVEYPQTLRAAFQAAAGILVVNPAIAESCRHLNENVHVIPSGFDAARFEGLASEPPPRQSFHVLFAGLPDEYMKGFHVLLEACHDLWQRRTDFELHVTSDDSSTVAAPFLQCRGWQKQRQLPLLMADCDVVVVPTVAQEALGRTAVEAMGAARPVIASRIGGLPYVVEDNVTGLLVEPDSPGELALAIERLMDDRDLCMRLGQTGRSRFLAEYPWDVIIERRYRPLFASLRAVR